jgi:hypothetical protein
VSKAKQEYEQKRSRSFQLHWTTDRPWLRYNEHDQMMFCTFCESQFKDKTGTGKFVTGCNNFRIDTIQMHETSAPNANAKTIAERPTAEKSEAAKVVHQLKAHEYSRLNILFRNAHAVAKHHLSFRTYTVICKLDKMKGHDIGDSYLNDKKAAEFLKKHCNSF